MMFHILGNAQRRLTGAQAQILREGLTGIKGDEASDVWIDVEECRLLLSMYAIEHRIPQPPKELQRPVLYFDGKPIGEPPFKADFDGLEKELGTASDAELARRFGVNVKTVRARRRKRGIAKYSRYLKYVPDEELGTMPDRKLARKYGVSRETVRDRRKQNKVAPKRTTIDDLIPIEELGKYPDKEIAKRIGVSITSVANKRRALGIRPNRGISRHKWTEEATALVGTIPDRELADMLGISISFVARKRRNLGRRPVVRLTSAARSDVYSVRFESQDFR